MWNARWPHVVALDSGSSGPGLSLCRGHRIVFLGKKPNSHSDSGPPLC